MNDELYKEFILELNRKPLHKKTLADFNIEQIAVNKSCGDDIKLQIKFDEAGNILDMGHQGQGCAIYQASVSLLLDDVLGKNIKELKKYNKEKMIEIFGMDVVYAREKCMMLGLNALKLALEKYE